MGNASIAASNEREAIREIIAVSNRHALPLADWPLIALRSSTRNQAAFERF
jgi:hypothetical protein